MPKKTSSMLVHLLLKTELVEKLDEFRFIHRFESRTEAIRWLLDFALKQNPKPKN
jgi:metal-responsive CopG/Arc/MetJ family transcriptional regulator